MKKLLHTLFIALLLLGTAQAQTKTITGTVIDAADGMPLPGVSVKQKGTTNGTQTAANGQFNLPIKGTQSVVVFTYIGYESAEVTATPGKAVKISLKTADQSLNEVVVVAYGTATKESLTGAVSSVSAKDIEKRPVSSVTGVLEGSSPGIQVNNTFGQPGSDATIRIRGFSSVNGSNDPLIVLDGVPYGGNISDINPNDIESISVLKDATSAALYGNRASNGVVIITSKKGSNKRGSLNAIINQGVYTRGIPEYERLNANEYMETMWKGYRNSLLTSNSKTYPTVASANTEASRSLVSDYLKYNIYNKPANKLFDENGKLVADAAILDGYKDDLDWFAPIERKGTRQDYNISGATATEKSNLYFSGGYLDEKGFVKRSDFNRFSGRVNGDITPKDWIKTGLSLAGSHQQSNQVTGKAEDAASYANPFMYARQIAPIYPVHLHDPATGEYILDENGEKQYDGGSRFARPQYTSRHVIWENELNKDRTFRNTLNGQAYVDINFLKDFTLTLKGDLNVRTSENQSYDNAIIGDGAGNAGRATREIYRNKNYTVQQLLNYGKNFGDHRVDILAGHENYYFNQNYMFGFKTKETFAGAPELINFTNITDLYDYQDNYRLESFLSRAKYNYASKYFAEASFRRDGTARFSRNTRWGQFWSLGGSWIISKEDFMQSLDGKVDDLKFRASYGQVGNDASAKYYAHYALYRIDQNANLAALYKSQNAAENAKWESLGSLSTAIEGRLFNKVNFNVEYFDKRSKDLLFDVNLALSAGATSTTKPESTILQNIGVVSNKGIEVTADVDILKAQDLRWNFGINATFIKNKIIELPEQNRANGIISGTKKYMEGHSVYDFWAYQFVGVDQMTGDALYLPDTKAYNVSESNPKAAAIPAANLVQIGDQYYTNFSTYGVRDWSGSAIPDVFGSFNTSLSVKNLTLSALFTYSLGGKTLDYSYNSLMSMSGTVSALHKDLLKAWDGVPEGMTATSANRINPDGIPVVDFARSNRNNQALSTRFLQDASYLVVKNISLSYNLPKTWMSRLDVNGMTVNAGVENLATFTKLQGMNPQQAFNGVADNAFVTPRVFSLGLNIKL
ncbi:MAG: SusC/RagA family TonB-linked outer membrane protein [Arcticibacter sp.]